MKYYKSYCFLPTCQWNSGANHGFNKCYLFMYNNLIFMFTSSIIIGWDNYWEVWGTGYKRAQMNRFERVIQLVLSK